MLETLLSHLLESGYKARLEPPSEAMPFAQILLSLTTHILQIRDYQFEIPSSKAPITGTSTSFFHFFLAFPHLIPKNKTSDAARLACLINKVSPLPGFGFSEADLCMTFHYVYPTTTFDPVEFDTLIAFIVYIFEVYAPLIEQLTTENTTYESLVKSCES